MYVLLNCRIEAAQCPDVVVAQIDPKKLKRKQSVNISVQRFSPLSSRWEHGSIQAGLAQEELRVLHLHPKAASGRLTPRQLGFPDASLRLKVTLQHFSGNNNKWHIFQLFDRVYTSIEITGNHNSWTVMWQCQNLKMKKAGKNFVWVKGYVLKGPLDRLQRKALGSIMYKLVFLLCLVL
uniref:Sip1 protein n=1 Tax=Mus musculus TaxID=10090 RepID=Q7TS76_MOUSE|nr:Sip1 protein [Mus musculus]